jgi:serine/threonine protein kinase
MTFVAGTRLGPYQILSLRGAGGMGEVYRAQDVRLDRTVAIKVLPALVASDADFRERFEREARAIAALSHPHICALYDVGEAPNPDAQNPGPVRFLVMEYLERDTLDEVLRRKPLPLDQTLRIAIQIADALDKAHRKGIVHRDLKPGNIILTASGAKLLDFGLPRCDRRRSAD